ncbi:MAG: histidinol-phosphate transaminase [Candidatus Aquirickettsiella gammari]
MTILTNISHGLKREKPARKIIKLDQNESPIGASPIAIAAGQKAMLHCHRYPGNEGLLSLKKCLSKHLSVLPENITLGNGSEGLLELIVKTYLTPLNSAVIPNYCFTGIAKIIRNSNVPLKIAKNTLSYISASTILEAIDRLTKIVFIVNPNNPTGNYINERELTCLLDKLPQDILIVIDEAYGEYVETDDYPSTIKLLPNYPNLIVTRTFSKLYGLAGLRLGYAISGLAIAASLSLNSLPFSVNAIALAAAEASLNDRDHINLARLLNQRGRSQLSKGLQNLGVAIIPSYANFLCIDLKFPAWPIYQQLLNHGIAVKPLHDYGLPNCLRLSIGTKKENQYFLNTFKVILAKIAF